MSTPDRHTPIRFVEGTHTYYGKKDKVYTSATTLVHKYQQAFDEEYWSLYKAIQKYILDRNRPDVWESFKKEVVPTANKEADLLLVCVQQHLSNHVTGILVEQQAFKDQWKFTRDDACAYGTGFHNKREKASYEKGTEALPGNPLARVNTTTQSLYTFEIDKLPDGYHPELMLYNHEYEIAGQADKVWITTIGQTRWIDIDDYKTNREIKLNNKWQKMKHPISHMDDCNFVHYNLQISIYGWMLEQYGYRVRHLSFSHYGRDEKLIQQYKLPYRINEVQDMLKHHAQHNSK